MSLCPKPGGDRLPPGVTVVRSPRRRSTLTIQVTGDRVLIRVPQGTPDSLILDVLNARRQWLERMRAKLAAQHAERQRPWFERPLSLHGRPITLHYAHLRAAHDWQVDIEGDVMRVAGPAAHVADPRVRAAVERWYQAAARAYLQQRIAHWSRCTGLNPAAVRVRDQRTRWGSCSAKGNVNLNWRLVMAPPEVADYVVVHELCHLREMNHSARFWRLVEQYMPDFREQRRWLNEHGPSLRLF